MSVKSIGAYVVALACVLSILACGTGGDSPTNVAIERTSEAQVAAEAATRATGPSVTQQLSTDRASEAQRASRAVSPTPSTRRSAGADESTDALFDTNTSFSGDYQLLLLAIARNEKTEAFIALRQNEEALNELDASGELSVGDSGSGRTLFLRRVVNSRLGRYEVAVQLLSSLIDEGNFISVALAELRHIYFLTSDFSDTAEYLERAINYQPSFDREYLVMYYRGLLRLSRSDIEDAPSDLVYAVTSRPRDRELWGEAMMFLIEAHNTDPHAETLSAVALAESRGYDPGRLTLLRAIVSSR